MVGRLLRFLGLSGGVLGGTPRPVDALERETFRHQDPPPRAPDPLPQFDLRRVDDPPRTRFEGAEDACPRPDRAGHYPDLGDLGRGLRNDVLAQMQRFRRGREPLPYQVSDDEEVDDNEDEV